MPQCILPSSKEERDLFIKAITTKGAVDGISADKKHNLIGLFIVEAGILKYKKLPPDAPNNNVVIRDEFDEIVRQYHFGEHVKGHPGKTAMIGHFKEVYGVVPVKPIEKCLAECPVCIRGKKIPNPARGKPIWSSGIWVQVHIDLIDMSSKADQGMHWILHMKDHASCFSFAVPLPSKEMIEVAKGIQTCFNLYGPPRICVTDRGTEFTGSAATDLMKKYGCKIVRTRARKKSCVPERELFK